MRSVSYCMSALLVALLPNLVTAHRSGCAAASAAYADFRSIHRADDAVEVDSIAYAERLELFERRSAEVAAANAQEGVSWLTEVNRFADFTDGELRRMLGYVKTPRIQSHQPQFSSFLTTESSPRMAPALSVDWRMNFSSGVHDQGACGSCWAHATTSVLEAHATRLGVRRPLATQQLVSCVENKKHCGGKGGCQGATGELALHHVQEHGIMLDGEFDGDCGNIKGQRIMITSYKTLETNKLEVLMDAVANHGPIVVSVAASGWFNYAKGIFAGCKPDTVVNHAVTLVGYGTQDQKDFWRIRNSWTRRWGEFGYMRLLRHKEGEYCGKDNDPLAGVGCEGPNEPKVLDVCGMCGILSDSVFPIGVKLSA